jgi:uncharacterized protein YndB with AHSA1/START domain
MTATTPASAMTAPPSHATIELERRLDAPPASVFAAFADEPLRRRWVRMPGRVAEIAHDFRVGGGERLEAAFTHPDGRIEQLLSTSQYHEITPGRRLVYSYGSSVDGVVRWVSLVTVVLTSEGEAGTLLTWTEQVSFLAFTGDGSAELPHLRGAIALRLNGLAQALAG